MLNLSSLRDTRLIQLNVKEALHIQKTPANNSLNRDRGYELPGCWIATVKKLGTGSIQVVLALTAFCDFVYAIPKRAVQWNIDIDIVLRPLHQTWTACMRKLRSHAYKLPSFSYLASLLPGG